MGPDTCRTWSISVSVYGVRAADKTAECGRALVLSARRKASGGVTCAGGVSRTEAGRDVEQWLVPGVRVSLNEKLAIPPCHIECFMRCWKEFLDTNAKTNYIYNLYCSTILSNHIVIRLKKSVLRFTCNLNN